MQEKIKVYRSFWKFDLGLALCLTFIIWGVYMFQNKEGAYKAGPMILILMFSIFAVCSIIRMIWKRPKLIITDEAVTVNAHDPWVVRFEDVQSFHAFKYNGQDVIGVRYKQGSENWAPEEEIMNSRKSRVRYPENLHPGKPYEIYVTDLSMTCLQLCDLLNERIIVAPLPSQEPAPM